MKVERELIQNKTIIISKGNHKKGKRNNTTCPTHFQTHYYEAIRKNLEEVSQNLKIGDKKNNKSENSAADQVE